MAILDDARAYIGATFGPTYTAWMALSDSDATKTLVASARYLNLLPWQGTFIGTLTLPTDLVWPRSGVSVDGVEVSSASTPTDVKNAQFEMAVIVSAKPAVVSQLDQGSNIKRAAGGGGVEVEFFTPTSAALGTALKIPYIVSQLIAKYLAMPSQSDTGGFGSAGSSCSSFATANQLKLVLPE